MAATAIEGCGNGIAGSGRAPSKTCSPTLPGVAAPDRALKSPVQGPVFSGAGPSGLDFLCSARSRRGSDRAFREARRAGAVTLVLRNIALSFESSMGMLAGLS